MKVVHSYKTYFPESCGGTEQVIKNICRGCARYDIKSSVLTTTAGKAGSLSLEEASVERYCRTIDVASSPLSTSLFFRFNRAINGADIIHYHFPWPQNDLMHLTYGRRKPAVVTYHSDIVRQRVLKVFYRPFMKRFLSAVDRIVVTSPNYLETSDDLKPYRDKVTVIPIGIDAYGPTTEYQERLDYWRGRLGKPFALFVGVLRYYKGLHYLLNAIQGSSCKVVIAGSGPMDTSLRSQASALGLDNVEFLGQIDDADKHALFELSRCVVFPSHLRSEAFGVTLLEGAQHARPLITAEIGTGTSYVNQDGVTGIVVPPADPQALRLALDMLMNDPELAARMGLAARERFLQYFSAERMCSAYHALYSDMLARA